MPTEPPGRFIGWAASAARLSGCDRSKRGAVVWRPDGRPLGSGTNYLPGVQVCTGTDACKAACGRRCIHAEAAVLDLLDRSQTTFASMLHVKVVDGLVVTSGPPSCWQCSKAILNAGIATMWLLHDTGWTAYTAVEFHRQTLANCGIWPPGASGD